VELSLAKKSESKKRRPAPKSSAAKGRGAKKGASPKAAPAKRKQRGKVAKPSSGMSREIARLPMAAPGMSIGLLGGSFNPPHDAHRQISLTALKRLGLDQVWWLVAPGNPLKDAAKLPSLEDRVKAAWKMARSPRIEVTGFAAGSPYTVDLIAALKRRMPGVNFVWLMGADNLAEFHRWRSFDKIFARLPIAVLDRPGYRLKARAGLAAQRFAPYRVDESDARGLARLVPPAWTILTHRLSGLSSTALRAKKAKKKKAAGDDKTGKKKRRRH
jgi:nicotinate-nucleotide adenylyltransferase